MISVLIANSDFNDIKRIVNNFSIYKQFRIICITSNNNETYNKILNLVKKCYKNMYLTYKFLKN